MGTNFTSDAKLAHLFGRPIEEAAFTPMTNLSGSQCIRIEAVGGMPVQPTTILTGASGSHGSIISGSNLYWNNSTGCYVLGAADPAEPGGSSVSFLVGAGAEPIAILSSGATGAVIETSMSLLSGTAVIRASGNAMWGSAPRPELYWKRGPAFVAVAFDTSHTAPKIDDPKSADWLNGVLECVEGLPQSSECVKPLVVEHAKSVVKVCAVVNVPEPSVDCDEDGNIEIFVKNGPMGLLLVATDPNLLQVFGSSAGDKWRARYDLRGPTWRTHLRNFLAPLANVRSSR
jgi:hypothetical protein